MRAGMSARAYPERGGGIHSDLHGMTQLPARIPAWLAAALLASACQPSPPPLQRMIAEPPTADYGDLVRRAQLDEAAAGGGVRLRWEFTGTGPERIGPSSPTWKASGGRTVGCGGR